MLSGVVLTKNEEQNIKDCLSCLSFCDEILVVDDNSTDGTVKIAEKLGARVLKRPMENDFSSQRNFGLEEAKGDWILFIDADERVSEELANEIKKEINQSSSYNGFYFKRIDFFINKWLKHGEIGSVRILRLARKNAGKWQRSVDEIWKIKGKTKTLKNPLLHYSHPSLSSFLQSINERSSLNARQFYKENKKVSFIDWLKPVAKFIWNYFFLFGFLDGISGFVFAVLMSFHSFLTRGKLYLLWKKEGGWR